MVKYPLVRKLEKVVVYMPFFPKPDPKKIKPSKNLCLGNPEKFKACLEEVIEENREGLLRLGRS
jgi:hypothetical protein